MTLGALLGAGRLAEVYEDSGGVVKLYRPGVGPEMAQHEAFVLDALRVTALTVPVNLGVSQIEGRWGLRISRMPGTALGGQIEAGNLPAVLSVLVDMHRAVLSCSVSGLPKIKQRLADRLGRAAHLGTSQQATLLDRLTLLPDGDTLCHGDFHPYNIMVDGQRAGIIDWPDATLGPPAADIARTYMLMALHMPEMAERYLEAMTRTGISAQREVMDWLPVIAGARLAEQVDGEADQLLAWCELA
jgi:aminoglycoside phosphotransferase